MHDSLPIRSRWVSLTLYPSYELTRRSTNWTTKEGCAAALAARYASSDSRCAAA
jgi:hypothetical protein